MVKIIKEIKQIAALNAKIQRMEGVVAEKMEVDDLDLRSARLISGCSVKGKHLYQNGVRLDNSGLVDELYYCKQCHGYEDDYYGTLYFKTDVPGQYVAVPFAT